VILCLFASHPNEQRQTALVVVHHLSNQEHCYVCWMASERMDLALYNPLSTLFMTRLFLRNAWLAVAILPVLCLLSTQSLACDPRNSGAPVGHLQGARPVTFAISSPSFSNGGKIPTKFTCDGTDVSPALTWTAPPSGTQSFTLKPGVSKQEVEQAMQGHILAKAELMGTYQR